MNKVLGILVVVGILAAMFSGNDNPSPAKIPISQSANARKHIVPSDCDATSKITGMKYNVIGVGINVRNGAGESFDQIINQKATSILKATQYITIDYTTTVFEECTKDGWSWIRVVDPTFLQDSHRGWVASKFLVKFQDVDGDKYTGMERVDERYSNIAGTNCAEIMVSESNGTMSMQQAKKACIATNDYLHK